MNRSVRCAQPSCCISLYLQATAVWATARSLADDLLAVCPAGDCQAVGAGLHENPELARQAVITDRSQLRYTALWVAACSGYVEIVQLLLEAGADVNGRSGAAVCAPLITALCADQGLRMSIPVQV